MNNALGILAALLGMIGAIPYILNTYRRKTKPHTTAWLIFLVLSIVSFSSQFALGARASIIFVGWTVVNNCLIVGLSLRKGAGYGGITRLNVISFLLACVGIVLWKTTDNALTALVSALFADAIGAALIVRKTYLHPNSETLFMWVLGIFSGLLNIAAVGALNPALLAAPVQITLFCVAIVAAAKMGGRKARGPSLRRAH